VTGRAAITKKQRMEDVTLKALADAEGTDRSAIIMMLTYVEAECRRLGEEDAARHAALAANLVIGDAPETAPERLSRRPSSAAAPIN
jgi:hypothetical protein